MLESQQAGQETPPSFIERDKDTIDRRRFLLDFKVATPAADGASAAAQCLVSLVRHDRLPPSSWVVQGQAYCIGQTANLFLDSR